MTLDLSRRCWAATLAAVGGLTACSTFDPVADVDSSPRRETLLAVTADQTLIRFQAATPRRIDQRVPITGLAPGETLVGIDFRVARGVLYGVTSAGRLVTIGATDGRATPVGPGGGTALQGSRFGVDFNPVADRVRVVSDTGQNLRLHPDTGALAATDPPLSAAAPGGPAPRVAAAGYTYNKKDERLTTNYAIDLARGWLVTQGSIEGTEPVVSPNTGRIFDVGALGTGPVDEAELDIADTDNAALAALRRGGRTALYAIDLASGKARRIDRIGDGGPLRGIAIEP